MSQYVLGLDLGPNSIGWAMLNCDSDGNPTEGFYDSEHAGHPPLGVRIFEAGLHNFDTAKEESLNQKRRTARSMRRNHARRNSRRRSVMRELVAAGLLPSNLDERTGIFALDAYELRAEALDRKLEPFELGRALYHLAQRRGFRSNRKSGQAKEDQGILKEIGELARAIEEKGCRTLGEFFHKTRLESRHDRVRAIHTRRDMYAKEFDSIIEAQRRFASGSISEESVTRIRHFIFYQHPFELTDERRERAPSRANLHRAPSVKACPLEPGQLCCPKGEWIAQRFRILKEVNNLRIADGRSRERPLCESERATVLAKLEANDRVKFDALRKEVVKLGEVNDPRFNLERGHRAALNGNIVEHKLAVMFGRKAWRDMPDSARIELRDGLLHEESPEELTELFIRYGADPDKAERLTSWNPPDGYIGYSKLALERIVPLLDKGLNEHEAITEAYPNRQSSDAMDKLPVLDSSDVPMELSGVTNPVVRRALVETRKVVNALVREHGRPVKVMIELARNMHEGPEGRKRTSKMQRDRQTERNEARARVEEYGGNPNSRSDLMRWLLWDEQQGECVYTHRPIPPSELFNGAEWDIDHILPHWQSLDDSYMNKVLVHRSANAEKGDRTLIQWLGEESDEFRKIAVKIARMVDDPSRRYPYPKFKRLIQPEVESDQFASRQLNDTRYISKAVVSYLQLLYPPELRKGEKAVQSCRGGLTAHLRYNWALNRDILDDILDKNGEPVMTESRSGEAVKSRADHRHHAIDAVVVALSTRAMLKRFQDYYKVLGGDSSAMPSVPLPWNTFREDMRELTRRITVSHRADTKLRGSLHEETFYGQAKGRDGEVLPDRFVTRKTLDGLTGKAVKNIRDDVVRDIITSSLIAKGWDGSSNGLPKDWHQDPPVMPDGTPIRRVRVETTITAAVDLGHRVAISGNNHHMEIAETAPKPGGERGKIVAAVIPMMEAASRARPRPGESRRPIVQTEYEDGKRFLMSLARKETVLVKHPITGRDVSCVVQKLAGNSEFSSTIDLYLRDTRDSRPASEGNQTPFLRLQSFKAWRDLHTRKVFVDPLGRYSGKA